MHLAADHAGFELKERVKTWLLENGFEVEDYGAFEFNQDDDYPDFILPAAEAVAKSDGDRGIIFGASGQGEAMAANRNKGVRAAVLYQYDDDIITLSREHNDANVLSIAARFLSEEEAIRAIGKWLKTDFSKEERHIRRISKF